MCKMVTSIFHHAAAILLGELVSRKVRLPRRPSASSGLHAMTVNAMTANVKVSDMCFGYYLLFGTCCFKFD
jgi:hypothetical protein